MTETPLFDLPAPTEQAPRKPIKGRSGAYLTNPMLALHGPGPADRRCHSCTHCLSLEYHGYVYHKCELRGINHGADTDHRLGWPTCGRYEQGLP